MSICHRTSLDTLHVDAKINSLLDRIEYYQRELQHGENICASAGRSPNGVSPYFHSVSEYIKVLRDRMEWIKADALKLTSYTGKQFADEYEKVQERLSLLPVAIHNILIWALQRKHRPIRYFSFATFPSYSFGEAHPTYPSEILAIEKIASHYSKIISRLTHEFKLTLPLICLSDRARYAYLTVGLDEESPIVKTEEFPRDEKSRIEWRQFVRDHFVPSQILMPRWAPGSLRFSVLIAHELMHPLLVLLNACRNNYLSFVETNEDEPATITTSQKKQWLNPVYGESILELSEAYRTVRDKFMKFAGHRGGQFTSGKSVSTIDSAFFESQLNEYCCDLGATVIAGPAYVYAFITDLLYPMEMPPKDEVQSSHPHPALRVYLMIRVLKVCGYHLAAARVQRLLKNRGYLDLSSKEDRDYLRWFKETEHDIDCLTDCILHYAKIKRVRESKFLKECDEIIKLVANNDPKSHRYNPFQILNAMWLNISRSANGPRYHMAWRETFKYCRAYWPEDTDGGKSE